MAGADHLSRELSSQSSRNMSAPSAFSRNHTTLRPLPACTKDVWAVSSCHLPSTQRHKIGDGVEKFDLFPATPAGTSPRHQSPLSGINFPLCVTCWPLEGRPAESDLILFLRVFFFGSNSWNPHTSPTEWRSSSQRGRGRRWQHAWARLGNLLFCSSLLENTAMCQTE